MPWLAIPFQKGSAAVKGRLSQVLGIKGIPTFVIIDGKTGMLLTATGREDVTKALSTSTTDTKTKVNAAKAVVEQWKALDRKPLSEASAGGSDRPFIIKFIMFFARNPMYLFGLLYFYKLVQKKMIEWYGDPDALPDDDDDDMDGPGGAGVYSEF